MRFKHPGAMVFGIATLLSGSSTLWAQLSSFAVLGGSTVTNTGPSVVVGDLGVSPGAAVVGFGPGIVVGGTIHAGDAVALQAQNDRLIKAGR